MSYECGQRGGSPDDLNERMSAMAGMANERGIPDGLQVTT